MTDTIYITQGSNEALLTLSKTQRLGLNFEEMVALRAYFRDVEQREPTDLELRMIAEAWSEPHAHKTLNARIIYTGPSAGPVVTGDLPTLTSKRIDGLFRTYLRRATERLPKTWLRGAFSVGGGVIAFDDRFDVTLKTGAVTPDAAASTILSIGARPVAGTMTMLASPTDERAIQEAVNRAATYNNQLGVPTASGEVIHRATHAGHPVTIHGSVGIVPCSDPVVTPQPDELIVLIGLWPESEGVLPVKQLQEVVLRAKNARLLHGISAVGIGGLSVACQVLCNGIGAQIDLSSLLNTTSRRKNLAGPEMVWLGNTFNQIVLALPTLHRDKFKALCDSLRVHMAVIGVVTAAERIMVTDDGAIVANISLSFLRDGVPDRELEGDFAPRRTTPFIKRTTDCSATLRALLAHPDLGRNRDNAPRFDYSGLAGGLTSNGTMQAGAVIIPFEALAVRDRHALQALHESGSTRGIAMSTSIATASGTPDPYLMAIACVHRAICKLVAMGADPDQVGLAISLSWGDTRISTRLGALVRCVQGLYQAALTFSTPFIDVEEHLNNTDDHPGTARAMPGTLVVSSIGIVPDVQHTPAAGFKTPGSTIYQIGTTRTEVGGSLYAAMMDDPGGSVPHPVDDPLETLRVLHKGIQAGLVTTSCAITQGGLAVALANLCSTYGAAVDLTMLGNAIQPDVLLFSESSGRFVVEVRSADVRRFEAFMIGQPCARIGEVSTAPRLTARTHAPTPWLDWKFTPPVMPVTALPQSETAINSKTNAAINASMQSASKVVAQKALPKVMVLSANGTTRDRDTSLAIRLAGGDPEIVHISQLQAGTRLLANYAMLVLPGGYSYGDFPAPGKAWAQMLMQTTANTVQLIGEPTVEQTAGREALDAFIHSGKPVIGIGNGFQALVQAGIFGAGVTLEQNASGQFEYRWVWLEPNSASPSMFTRGLREPLYMPVAHLSGRICFGDTITENALISNNLHALTYSVPAGRADQDGYPHDPSGSSRHVAALTNAAGNVFGIMAHPEQHIFPWQRPIRHAFTPDQPEGYGLALLQNGIRLA